MKPDFSVAGAKVLITGGAGGIGLAFARAFADAGARVHIADVKAPDQTPHGVAFTSVDARSDADVAALAAKLDGLDCLIHCAGRLIRDQEYELDTFRDIVDIHLFGAMRFATAFREHLKSSDRASIIFIGSMYSFFGAPHIPAYSSAKTALVGLIKSLAIGFAPDRIRVNGVAPGWIKTEISRRGRENPEFNAKVVARLPNGEWAEPEELAGAVIFLASPASRLVNGVMIPVDGGYVAS